MLRTATAALVLSFTAGAAAAASLRVLDTACLRSPVAAVAPGLGGICAGGTRGNHTAPAPQAAAHPFAVDAAPTFAGSPPLGARPPAHAMNRAPVSAGQGPGKPPFVVPGAGPHAALPPTAAIPPIFDPAAPPKHPNDADPIAAIPLPASGWLMLGIFGALALARRRRTAA